jgi:hypothetical protein
LFRAESPALTGMRVPSFDATTSLVSRGLGIPPSLLIDSFGPASQADLLGIVSMRAANRGAATPWDDEAYLRWRYQLDSTDAGWGQLYALRHQRQIIGLIGTESIMLDVEGRQCSGQRVQDILIAPHTRESGLGLWLKQVVFRDGDFTMTVGCNANSIGTVRRIYDSVARRETHVMPLDISSLLRRKFGNGPWVEPFARVGNTAAGLWRSGHRLWDWRGTRLELADRFTDEMLAGLQGEKNMSQIGMVRKADHLNWRLIDNPRVRYRVSSAWIKDRCIGYMAASVTNDLGGTSHTTALRLIDWCFAPGFSTPAVSVLLPELCHFGRANGCERITTTVLGCESDTWLGRSGFLRRPAGEFDVLGIRWSDRSFAQEQAKNLDWAMTELAGDSDG